MRVSLNHQLWNRVGTKSRVGGTGQVLTAHQQVPAPSHDLRVSGALPSPPIFAVLGRLAGLI